MEQRREQLRVADVDRSFVAGLLKTAVDEGRLSLGEYDERLRDAYAARTYGDLDRLIVDLPGIAGLTTHPDQGSQLVGPAEAGPAPMSMGNHTQPASVSLDKSAGTGYPSQNVPQSGSQAVPDGRGVLSGWLAAVWGAWLFVVSINVVIWLMVSVSVDDGPVYFWPMWVAGPWGTVLLATTFLRLVAGNAAGGLSPASADLSERAAYRMERMRYRMERREAKRRARAARRGR